MNNKTLGIPRRFMEKGLPVKVISKIGRREKLGRPRISEMHYWWTRKPLVTSRAAILGSLLNNDISFDQFRAMLGIGKTKKSFEYQLNPQEKELINNICIKLFEGRHPEAIKILDPFAGAGCIPLEALRTGFSVHASDYNPVAWLLLNTTLVYPMKFGNKLLKIVKESFNEIKSELSKTISDLYPPSPKGQRTLGYIYAWAVNCPNCGKRVPLVNNWKLGGLQKENAKYFLEPTVKGSELCFTIKQGSDFPPGTNVRGKGQCLFCHSTIPNKHIVNQIRDNTDEMMLAVAYRMSKTVGADFRLPTDYERTFLENNERFAIQINALNDCIPRTKMTYGVIRAARYLGTWDRIYFPRQLVYLAKIVELGRKIIQKWQTEENVEFGLAIGFYIACLLGKLIPYNCRLAGWQSHANLANPTVAFRTYPIVWDHFEVHPFEGSSCSLDNAIKGVLDGLEEILRFTKGCKAKIKVSNSSVLEIQGNAVYDAVITDPPYLDDVPYPEVSDLFYVWQQRLLSEFLKNTNSLWLNLQTPRDEDLSSNHKDRTDEFVNMGLAESFKVINRLLKKNGVLVLFYAHSKLEAWEFVVNALMQAGFQITATYPLTTESITNPITTGKASIFSSILLFARKRTSYRRGILENLDSEVEEKIYPRLEEFWASGLRHADLTGAAIGPVLEVITGYEELKSKFGKIDVLNILQLASKHVINFVLFKHTGKDTFFDTTTAFYLYTVVENINGKKGTITIPYDNAHILSKSINADLKFMEHHGLIDDGGTKGRKNRIVRFLSHDMRDTIEGATLIDAVHRAMKAYSSDGRKGLQDALKEETHNLEEIKVALELLARADNPPGKDGEVARKMLGLREDLKKGDKTLFDYF